MSWDWSYDTWIVAAGMLSALSCALLGNFLLLRRMSMMGDAISHAVLPGLAVAFLLFHSRGTWFMFGGAVAAGLLTAYFTQAIHQYGKVEASAAMGVTFTALFAVGLLLLVKAHDLQHVDIDPECVLYGAVELTPLHTVRVFGLTMPRAVATLAPVLVINGLFVLLFYKELKISSFDPQLATTLGINAKLMHYLLMTLVAATTVASFESVGSILVIAMLIVPAAAAHLLTDRLPRMIFVSLVIAALTAVLGRIGAMAVPAWFGFGDTSTAGSMAVAVGLIFAVVMLAAPRHGVVSKALHRAALRLRIAREDILGLLYRLEELGRGERRTDRAFISRVIDAGPILTRLAFRQLTRRGDVAASPAGLTLTDAGRDAGRSLVRSHRLWETYLHDYLNLPADHTHASAERLEHVTNPAMQQRLAERTDRPTHDPQGKEIPR